MKIFVFSLTSSSDVELDWLRYWYFQTRRISFMAGIEVEARKILRWSREGDLGVQERKKTLRRTVCVRTLPKPVLDVHAVRFHAVVRSYTMTQASCCLCTYVAEGKKAPPRRHALDVLGFLPPLCVVAGSCVGGNFTFWQRTANCLHSYIYLLLSHQVLSLQKHWPHLLPICTSYSTALFSYMFACW